MALESEKWFLPGLSVEIEPLFRRSLLVQAQHVPVNLCTPKKAQKEIQQVTLHDFVVVVRA